MGGGGSEWVRVWRRGWFKRRSFLKQERASSFFFRLFLFHLVDEHFGEDRHSTRARNLAVEHAIEPVRGGAVDKEAEGGKTEKTPPAEPSAKGGGG